MNGERILVMTNTSRARQFAFDKTRVRLRFSSASGNAGRPRMISSFATSVVLLIVARNGTVFSTHAALLMTVAVTTVCWLLAAYLGPQTDRSVLISFCTLVRPFGPGWASIRREAGLRDDERSSPDNIPMALAGWVAGCTAIWSALFAVGNFLYGRYSSFAVCTIVFVVSGVVLVRIVTRLWSGSGEAAGVQHA
jgi:SSS family solute:Na+ symporter